MLSTSGFLYKSVIKHPNTRQHSPRTSVTEGKLDPLARHVKQNAHVDLNCKRQDTQHNGQRQTMQNGNSNIAHVFFSFAN